VWWGRGFEVMGQVRLGRVRVGSSQVGWFGDGAF